MKLISTFIAVCLVASAAGASCALSLRHENGVLSWNPVAGAERYQIQESFNELATSRNLFTLAHAFKILHRVTAPTTVHYLVTAEVSTTVMNAQATSEPACTARIAVELTPDPELRKLTRRIVFPLVGSAFGVSGGRFRTSLKLTASNPNQKGTIVFHPTARAASDNDPSIAFHLVTPGDTKVFDDIVEAIGQSGLGSLDIIPDESGDPIVPLAEARLYNDTPGGTFGTHASAVFPVDYLRPPSLKLTPPEPGFRLSVGFRAMTEASITVLVTGTDGRLRDLRTRNFSAGWMQLTSLADLAGSEIKAGESATLLFSGAVIPFYTLTENRTNDPMLHVPEPAPRSLNVGKYVD